jgi:hypothetical protein
MVRRRYLATGMNSWLNRCSQRDRGRWQGQSLKALDVAASEDELGEEVTQVNTVDKWHAGDRGLSMCGCRFGCMCINAHLPAECEADGKGLYSLSLAVSSMRFQ